MVEKKKDIWVELRKPFPKEVVGVLPKPYKKDSPKGKCNDCGGYHGLPAAHLNYVGHAVVTDRLNNVAGQEGWNWEPVSYDEAGLPRLDRSGNLWIKLTINGVTRLGYGDGSMSIKELIGDALRNAAMRFGVALDLWSKEELESTLVVAEPTSPKTTIADAIKEASKLLSDNGIESRDDKLTIIKGIAEIEDLKQLTGNMMVSVLRVLRVEPIDDLRALYLPQATAEVFDDADSDDDMPPDAASPTVEYTDNTGLYDQLQKAVTPVWEVPEFKRPQSGMVRPEQTKLIRKWLEHLTQEKPETSDTLVNMLIGKDMPGTYDEAMAVILELAEQLNELDQAKVAA